ncbi:hypothetical protein CDL12_11704 [Handroanthus impetiginosus]|uniref:Uncharacterized protein n=1 Tax=Handroanthus impetiginosus TaxID=429701 RepID=A0A2G9HED9_9LAMI|nr:hypothetical protein CDL12_11704 [Handroanthus impetiginosus]
MYMGSASLILVFDYTHICETTCRIAARGAQILGWTSRNNELQVCGVDPIGYLSL